MKCCVNPKRGCEENITTHFVFLKKKLTQTNTKIFFHSDVTLFAATNKNNQVDRISSWHVKENTISIKEMHSSSKVTCRTARFQTANNVCAEKDDVNGSNKNGSTDWLRGGDSLCPRGTRTSLHSVVSMIALAEHTVGAVALATVTRASNEQKGPLCAQETFCAARPVSLGLHSYQ